MRSCASFVGTVEPSVYGSNSKGDVLIVDAVVINERPVEGPEVVGGAAVEDGYVT